MKTSAFVRSAFFTLLLATSLTACKKEPEVNPELSGRVVGDYTVSEVEMGGKRYPVAETNLKGGLEVLRESETSVGLDLNIRTTNNGSFLVGTVDDIQLTDVGNDEVDLDKDGDNMGRGGKGKLTIKVNDSAGKAMVITLKK